MMRPFKGNSTVTPLTRAWWKVRLAERRAEDVKRVIFLKASSRAEEGMEGLRREREARRREERMTSE